MVHSSMESPTRASNTLSHRAILDQVELKLALKPEKLRATRHVARGSKWGVLFGFGPGLTVETVMLHGLST
ncbi:hypothetical protein CsSME_00020440 [Camellia sinensis var. sinensis]